MDWAKTAMRRLHQALNRRGWRRQDAEDVIQDAFLRMQVYCSEGGEVRNSEAFLMRTVLNFSVNLRSRDTELVSVEQSIEDPSLILGLAPAADEVIAADECLARLSTFVDAMTPRTREIFLLHYVDEYTYPQIAKQLGISVSAIEKHMARAMLALTEELSGHAGR